MTEPLNESVSGAPDASDPQTPLTRRQRREQTVPVESAAVENSPVEGVPVAEAIADDEPADEFERAMQALRAHKAVPLAPRRVTRGATPRSADVAPRNRAARRKATTIGASVGAMSVIGMLAFAMLTPLVGGAAATAQATVSVSASGDQDLADEEVQAFVTSSQVANSDVTRTDGYSTQTYASMAAAAGINSGGAFFENDPTADIQWPFMVGTSMSSGYGMRWGTLHEGIDFTPGLGAPVQSVADGVVRTATEAGGAYGVNVYIDHVIDGEVVTTHYAHMQYGSLKVAAGDRVKVGDIIGLTGNTGRSTGPHMHFEVRYNGKSTDPLPWLEEHANTRYTPEQRAEVEAQIDDLLGGSSSSDSDQ